MPRYLLIKIMRDGTMKTDFLNDGDLLSDVLHFLRDIDREYKVLAWTGSGYTIVKEWAP